MFVYFFFFFFCLRLISDWVKASSYSIKSNSDSAFLRCHSHMNAVYTKKDFDFVCRAHPYFLHHSKTGSSIWSNFNWPEANPRPLLNIDCFSESHHSLKAASESESLCKNSNVFDSMLLNWSDFRSTSRRRIQTASCLLERFLCPNSTSACLCSSFSLGHCGFMFSANAGTATRVTVTKTTSIVNVLLPVTTLAWCNTLSLALRLSILLSFLYRADVYKIHWLMAALPFTKSLSLIFHAVSTWLWLFIYDYYDYDLCLACSAIRPVFSNDALGRSGIPSVF